MRVDSLAHWLEALGSMGLFLIGPIAIGLIVIEREQRHLRREGSSKSVPAVEQLRTAPHEKMQSERID